MKKILFSIFTLFLVNLAFSQSIIFSEDFNYPTGVAGDSIGGGLGTTSALGDTIWKKHSGTATGGRCVKYVTSPLVFSGYAGSNIGGAASFQNTVGSADINGYIGQSINSGSVYAAFILRVDSSGISTIAASDYSIHFADLYGTGSVTNFRDRIFIRAGQGSDSTTKFRLGLSKGTTGILTASQTTAGAKLPQYTSTEYNIGQPYLCVLKYTFNTVTTKDDEMALFIFSGAIPITQPTPDVTVVDTGISDLSKIQSFCIRQGSVARAKGTIDGIRIFTSWDAATIAALPIKFTSFDAIGLNNSVNLKWSVITSDAVLSYVIEKSVDGTNYSEVISLPANGKMNFGYTDKSIGINKILYYRIKTLSAQGKTEYSDIRKVNLNYTKLNVFPNPVENNLVISYPKLAVDANLSLNTIDGKNLMSVSVKAGTTQFILDISTLTKGNYIVTLLDVDGNKYAKQIIKK